MQNNLKQDALHPPPKGRGLSAKEDNMTDKEDEIECTCYMIISITEDGKKLYTDRVYRDQELCKKRVNYLNNLSKNRAKWFYVLSELGN